MTSKTRVTKDIQDLITISRYFGSDKEYTLAGGGNTSYKNDEFIWIKASGTTLATIDEDGFAQLYRDRIKVVGNKQYTDDIHLREVHVKDDLIAANVFPEKGKRPSVETSFHEMIEYAFVVHMHPTIVNALMCSMEAKQRTAELFGDDCLYIPSAAGFPLFIKVREAMILYREKYGQDAKIIFLQNHGIFVSADNIREIKDLYTGVTSTIQNRINNIEEIREIEVPAGVTDFLPEITKILSEKSPRVTSLRHNTLQKHFYKDENGFKKIALPFTPDIIVYCKAAYLYIEESDAPENILSSFRKQYPGFLAQYGYPPKIIVIRDYGVIAIEENSASVEIVLDVYEDLMKISRYSEAFGGPHFMSEEEITFIENWEVENYRRKVSRSQTK